MLDSVKNVIKELELLEENAFIEYTYYIVPSCPICNSNYVTFGRCNACHISWGRD